LLAREVIRPDWSPGFNHGMDFENRRKDGQSYQWIACYSPRGIYSHFSALLRPIVTPTMGTVRPHFAISLADPLSDEQRQLRITFQIHAVGYTTEPEDQEIGDIPEADPPG